MKRLIDVASGSDPSAGDTSWDNVDASSRVQDAVKNPPDWQEDGLPPWLRQTLCVVSSSS